MRRDVKDSHCPATILEGIGMSKVIADISMSLDGYVTAGGVDFEHGLGIGGEGIHGWVLEEPRSPVDEEVLAQSFDQTGAVVLGRRLFDIVDGPNGWNDDIGYGYDQDQAVAPPCFVVTHQRPAKVRLSARFRFVTAGVAEAIEQARAAAGEKDVVVMGGANVIDQCLAAGLVDELRIHLSPLVVGAGTRLFELVGPTALVQRKVTESPRAAHLVYEVVRSEAAAS
jgi:dihydrofolate reductase